MLFRRTYKLALVFLIGLISACTPKLEDDKGFPLAPAGIIQMVDSQPKTGARDVPLDTQIFVTFGDKIDVYSVIPENFELWTADGDRVGAPLLVSHELVDDPQGSGKKVSRVKIELYDSLLSPFTTYILAWGSTQITDENGNVTSLGIAGLKGESGQSESVSFTTGDELASEIHTRSEFKVESISPGRVLSRGKVFDFSASLGSLVNPSVQDAYLTTNPRAPIVYNFTQPFLVDDDGLNPPLEDLSSVNGIPIENFPHMVVATFDAATPYDQLFAYLLDVTSDPQAWNDFRGTYDGRLNGKVYSANGRRSLVFRLDEDERYPDTGAQVVVSVVTGLRSFVDNEKLTDNFTSSVMIHLTRFSFPGIGRFVDLPLPDTEGEES